MPWLSQTGLHRLWYRSRDRQTGLTVTARLWLPTRRPKKSEAQTLTEVEGGLYYLDFDFEKRGAYGVVIYEDGEPTAFNTWRVRGGLALIGPLVATTAVIVEARRAATIEKITRRVSIEEPVRTAEAGLQ